MKKLFFMLAVFFAFSIAASAQTGKPADTKGTKQLDSIKGKAKADKTSTYDYDKNVEPGTMDTPAPATTGTTTTTTTTTATPKAKKMKPASTGKIEATPAK